MDFSLLNNITGIDTLLALIPKICFKDIITPKHVSIFINLSMHVVILALVLYIFIQLVVDHIVTETLNELYTDLGTDIIINPLLSSPVTAAYLKNVVDYQSIYKLYGKPDPFTTSVNGILYASIGTIVTILALQLILNVILTKYMACYDYSLLHVVFENATIFIFVGCFEFIFFWFIGRLYVPVLPSYVTGLGLNHVINILS